MLEHPEKEKAQGKGRVCAAAMCLRSDEESLKGVWVQKVHRVSCLGAGFSEDLVLDFEEVVV